MSRDYPVGKAQQAILDKLGKTASGYAEAERIFDELGITVASKRVGRQSVPVVTVQDRFGGGFESDGSGVSYRAHDDVDLSAIEEYIEK